MMTKEEEYKAYDPQQKIWFNEFYKLDKIKNEIYKLEEKVKKELGLICGVDYESFDTSYQCPSPGGFHGLSLAIKDMDRNIIYIYLMNKKDIAELLNQTKSEDVEDLVGRLVEILKITDTDMGPPFEPKYPIGMKIFSPKQQCNIYSC